MAYMERLFTPRKGERGPLANIIVEAIADSGGGWYRPPFRTQNPSVDPREPGGGESTAAGNDHGWANCTMSAGAMVLAFDTLGATSVWGGDLRHHQSDQSGGTDLNDLKEAWAAYGQTLSIRSGNGWTGLVADRQAGRAIALQGEGGTPGAGTYTGGHCIAVLPETHSDGRWLIGNPECTGYEWVSESALRDWAENWSSGIAWARSDPHPPGGGSGGDMARFISCNGYENMSSQMFTVSEGSDWYYLDGTRGGSFSSRSDVRCFGLVDAGEGADYYMVLISTGTPYSDKVARPTLVMIRTDNKPAYVPPPSTGDGEDCDVLIADAVEARDKEWIAHLTPD